jgi:TonB family protein
MRVLISVLLATGATVLAQAPQLGPHSEPGKQVAVYAPKPEYPEAARANGLEGSGVFLLHVGRDGTVKLVDVLKSTGHRILDRAAIAAFQQWRFRTDIEHTPFVKVPMTFTTHGIPSGWKIVE